MALPGASHFRVAIIGGGFGGLGLGIRLRQAGFLDFVILERAPDVGGVWRDNAYPGCACDVQSNLYSLSFAPNPDWSRSYSPREEIHEYLRQTAGRFGVRAHCRFSHPVTGSRWDEAGQRWVVQGPRGTVTADVLVTAVGGLSEPSIPALPGLGAFRGKVMHSAQWDAAHDLAGRKVAVVGTGASAIQFVPHIQPRVEKLLLFQRTAPWILPRRDRPVSSRMQRLYRAVPAAQLAARGILYVLREMLVLGFTHPGLLRRAQKLALRHLHRQVPDPVLREKLTPTYTLGCKRILISDDYLPALTRPNVEVVTDAIREILPHGIVTRDGTVHEVDTLIFGTGFQVTDMPIARQVRGHDGRTLDEVWEGSPRAHLGTTVAGFPNFFMLQGPNTGLGHTSVLTMMESQMDHVLGALRHLDQEGLAAVEPRPEAQAAFVGQVDQQMARTVWMQGGCASWYLDRTGRNSTLWPGSTFAFRRRVQRFNAAEYLGHPRARTAPHDAPVREQQEPAVA
jgi:cation diffusion facilitator CzcD-associated flavoprotein CzcO